MSNKIIHPFAGPLTANGLKVWLGQCEDGFDNYQDTHKGAELGVKTRIRLTGASLAELQMAEWWSVGRKEYLELATWEMFVQKLKDRFLPVDWKTDALEKFYGCMQGKRDFRVFAAELVQCCGTLPSGTISTTIIKYHLLFFAHPQLYLRMRALQGFDIASTSQTPDQLIALMAAQWDSLVADSAARGVRSLSLASQSSSTTTTIPLRTSINPAPSSSSPSGPPRLTEEEKTALANGCWNCRKKPGEPDWTPHTRNTCPGNPDIGARPGRDYVAPSPGDRTVVAAAMGYRSESPPPVDEDTDDDGIPWGESDDE
ncbi:hypothetical protein DFP72DRAFT_394630 [Ephemerocybe angulata]|uniref:Retrotransposon gag domain-containing protein n=1 Tax=Ephemerocybe angulata TaxID=980116 RepID=A0A8H6HXY6_9AGAR|nr:hypothetical protein DFP72DRAFT_394630 [Tulosesus angulatus]